MALPWIITGAAAGLLAGPPARAAVFTLSTEAGLPPRSTCPACPAQILPGRRRRCPVLPVTGRCPACRTRIGPYPLAAEAAAGLARRIFSRGDSNVLNWLWDGASIRVVDYEFAGYSDLAFDCADLTEHVSSRQADIDDREWAEITGPAGLGGEDQRRFRAARRTCALRWLAVLWKQRDSRAGEFASQLDRVRRLQGAAAAI